MAAMSIGTNGDDEQPHESSQHRGRSGVGQLSFFFLILFLLFDTPFFCLSLFFLLLFDTLFTFDSLIFFFYLTPQFFFYCGIDLDLLAIS